MWQGIPDRGDESDGWWAAGRARRLAAQGSAAPAMAQPNEQAVPTHPVHRHGLWSTGNYAAYLTRLLSLKIGRMMLIAMKPTIEPMATIMSGSIMAVTLLITALSSRA